MKRILDSLGESYISILKITAALMVFLHHVRVFTDNSFFTRGFFFSEHVPGQVSGFSLFLAGICPENHLQPDDIR